MSNCAEFGTIDFSPSFISVYANILFLPANNNYFEQTTLPTTAACPNIDRDRFTQGSIYTDNLYEVWNKRFEPFRNRKWARTGICKDCKAFKMCLGNGMHNWHGTGENVINCHYRKTLQPSK